MFLYLFIYILSEKNKNLSLKTLLNFFDLENKIKNLKINKNKLKKWMIIKTIDFTQLVLSNSINSLKLKLKA